MSNPAALGRRCRGCLRRATSRIMSIGRRSQVPVWAAWPPSTRKSSSPSTRADPALKAVWLRHAGSWDGGAAPKPPEYFRQKEAPSEFRISKRLAPYDRGRTGQRGSRHGRTTGTDRAFGAARRGGASDPRAKGGDHRAVLAERGHGCAAYRSAGQFAGATDHADGLDALRGSWHAGRCRRRVRAGTGGDGPDLSARGGGGAFGAGWPDQPANRDAPAQGSRRAPIWRPVGPGAGCDPRGAVADPRGGKRGDRGGGAVKTRRGARSRPSGSPARAGRAAHHLCHLANRIGQPRGGGPHRAGAGGTTA